MRTLKLLTTFCSFGLISTTILGQHNNEFFNDGAVVTVQNGAEVTVWGDFHNYGTTATLDNNGQIEVQGDHYSDNLFQQRGTGTTLLINDDVNVGQTQFISGSYAVRGGQAQIGVNDGSFYNLQLANDQGIVWLNGTGNIADVRNSLDFNGVGSPVVNRIVTHDPTAIPGNGNGYDAIFGLMNPTTGMANMLDNTMITNGTMSGVDNGYIQGKMRRAISPAGGTYGYCLGLEPAGAGAQRGFQYMHFTFGANNYDVLEGYFQSGLDNTFPAVVECVSYEIDYWGGTDHGQWIFNDITGAGTGPYEARVWPQDDNFPAKTVWLVTKDNSIQGTPDDCGPTPIGLDRAGFDGFSQFGVAASSMDVLPVDFLNINAEPNHDHIEVVWEVASEINLDYYNVQRSLDGIEFETIDQVQSAGNSNEELTYSYKDYNVARNKMYYYRYESVDIDLTLDYSPIVSARINGLGDSFSDGSVMLYPNPTDNNFALELSMAMESDVEITVLNNLGQVVHQLIVPAKKGTSAYNIQSENWSTGMYQIQLREMTTGNVVMKKILKK